MFILTLTYVLIDNFLSLFYSFMDYSLFQLDKKYDMIKKSLHFIF